MITTKYGDIVLLEYPNEKEMNLATFRISEFFEGALKGKVFTADEFIEVWSDEDGNMDIFEFEGDMYSYFSYWDGINFPKKILDKFVCRFDLSKREKEVVKATKNAKYIITLVNGGLETTRRHEFSHAFWFLDKEYAQKATEIVESISDEIRTGFISGLIQMGYTVGNRDYENEEIHAYLVGYDEEEFRGYFPLVNTRKITEVVKSIGELFDEKYNKLT